ncbi:dihydrofolate reductase family protein [Nonomuraea sp. K274]|uniref:Dihydrofolate reductase family protein n=1 Tax=Nonomuraea cypriaca TaxID=1187855 RepID=A0A931A3S7_9ACTN|nr:dihydrofolate reductase family protein [Nonomuraea cypriaca]MBF8184573.1 dihydrofolate reductase family protein [Nonomuraea cypriaca]
MGRVVLSVFTTVDGVIENPHEWTFQFASPDAMKTGLDQIRAADALLLGRVTYDGFAAAWPSMTDDAGYADRMNSLPKYVVTTTLDKGEWNNTTVIRENPAERIAQLKKDIEGDMLIFGSATLVRWLLREQLIDELRLVTYPVVAGKGARLFDESVDTTVLRLTGSQTFSSGVLAVTYEPTGEGLIDPAPARRAATESAEG